MRFVYTLSITLLLLGLPATPVTQAAGVVGTGTAASCTEQALVNAVSGGGSISFSCGPAPVTITLTAPLDISAPNTTLDGARLITLSGGNTTRIINHRSYGQIGSSTLTLMGLRLVNGFASGADQAANGGAIHSVFEAANPTYLPILNLIGVTFENNQSQLTSFSSGNAYDFGGGALYSQGGTVSIIGSSFINNHAKNAAGGAIHILQSSLKIESSSFEQNSAIGNVPANSQGGAIYIDGLGREYGSAGITYTSFKGNTSYNSGGAIYVNMYENTNEFAVHHSSFIGNAIVGGEGALGGAISGGSSNKGPDTGNARIWIDTSTFANNFVKRTAVLRQCGGSGAARNIEDGSGGALAFAQRARITITNSTFSQNQALGSCFNANGGALYVVNNSDQFVITNSTFANNSAGWVGGAISNAQINTNPGGIVRNTIFWNNTASGIANFQQQCSSELDSVASLQYPGRLTNANYYNDVTCFKGKSAPSQTNLPDFRDALLKPLTANGGPTMTMALDSLSPARDNAQTSFCPYDDQRGLSRSQGGLCDIGAYEFLVKLSVTPRLIYAESSAEFLTVYGDAFTPQSKVLWNGQPLPTEFASSTSLQALMTATRLALPAEVQITVSDSSLGPAQLSIVEKLSRVYSPLVRR